MVKKVNSIYAKKSRFCKFLRNYSTQLVVSVVGNAPKITDLAFISEMQQMTSSVCSLTSEGYEKQLKDTRDQQYYWVGKMKDGKCWMLQNLALGDSEKTYTLTSANSNVNSSWTLPKSYTQSADGVLTSTAISSWNFGERVLAVPLAGESCEDDYCNVNNGFVDVSDEGSFQPTYTAATGTWTWGGGTGLVPRSTLVAVNCTAWSGSGASKVCTAGTYDAHYLVGNYYSWNAATAGTGGSITEGEASGSICPKGWKLPTGKSTTAGSFGGLLRQYGVNSSVSGSVGTGANNQTYNIAGAPLRFVRGGGSDYVKGRDGIYWSSTADSGSIGGTYKLYFNASFVNTSSGGDLRYNGFSVRCISE